TVTRTLPVTACEGLAKLTDAVRATEAKRIESNFIQVSFRRAATRAALGDASEYGNPGADCLDLDQRVLAPLAKAFRSLRPPRPLIGTVIMFRSLCLSLALIVTLATPESCRSADNRTLLRIQEEVWALPLIHPTIAYVVRPIGNGPFPLAVMNHGVSL